MLAVMIARLAMILLGTATLTHATAGESRPGRASAEWITNSASALPEQPLHTAIRLTHDHGWHSYWLNPGEAGLATTMEWKLPPGWTHGGLQFPVPVRFSTGGLAGFGYEGVTRLPVVLTPPSEFTGKALLQAVVSWLACGNDGCVPGKAEISLEITAGPPQPTAASAEILAAIDRVPRTAGQSVRLQVADEGSKLTLKLHAEDPSPLDFARCEVFPRTPDVIAPDAEIRFARSGDAWVATAAKSEFAKTPLKELTLVLATKDAGQPLEITWKAD
jgi:thiol:disulfide interchange protein DsbD